MIAGKGPNMENFAHEIKRFLRHMALWILLVSAGLYFMGCADKIPGFLLGATASVIYLLLAGYRVYKSTTLPPRKAVAYMRTGWLIRLIFVFSVLVVSVKLPQVDFLAAVGGLLLFQMVILFNGYNPIVRSIIAKDFTTKGVR
jgi:hypothetical protein